MNWFKFFRLVGNKKGPNTKHPRRPQQALRLEELEVREVPAAPFVVSVFPATGGLLDPSNQTPSTTDNNIVVVFSEDVTGANVAANYRLFASDGTQVSIPSVSYNPGTFTATITGSTLTVNGGQLTAGTYSLFLRGDKIVDVDESLPLARPGELVVANVGRNSLSTVSLTGSGLGAVQTVDLPAQGTTNYLPSAITSGDVNNDGVSDVIVASSGQNTLNVYLGSISGGFSLVPDLVLTLPSGSAASAIVVADLNADNKPDIAVANSGPGSVRVFINQNTAPGELAFDSGTDYSVGLNPVGLVAGRFDNDANVDLAVANGTADSSNNYNINIITGKGDGTFNATTAIVVGTTTPANLTLPSSIAVGRFDAGNSDDLVVGGSNGIAILRNTSSGSTPTFTETFVSGSAVTSVATTVFRSNAGASPRDDVVATTTASSGQLLAYMNDGTGVFTALTGVAANVSNPDELRVRDLTGDGRGELVYVNNIAAGGVVSRVPLQAGFIATAVGAAATPIVITSTNHGLVTGQRVTIAGNAFASANGTFYITRIDADTFSLNGTSGPVGTGAGGTWIALTGGVFDATAAGPIVVTSPNHGLRSGQQITITGATGNTASNGTWFITRIDANTFALNGSNGTGGGTYNSGSATWTLAPYQTGATPVGVTLADFSGDGILDLVTANKTENTTGTLSYYTGSGTAGVGDGTFLAATNLPLAGSAGRPVATAVGDLNGDGVPDLVATDTKNNQIHVFLGFKGGGYSAPTTKSLTAGGNSRNPVSVAIGDVNNDGKQDVVVASNQDSVVAIFTGNGDGTLNNQTRAGTGSGPTQVVLADINNDGDLDLLVAHNGSKSRGVTVRLGNGNGTFQNQIEVFTGKSGQPRSSGIVAADFNRDGNLDFAVADDNAPGTVRVALGAGNGTFPSANISTLTVGTNPTAIVAADFNADGFVDIATASRSDTTTDNVSVLLNNVGTGFQTAINTSVPTGLPLNSLRAVNVNSDAFIDLVVTSTFIDVINNTTKKNGADGLPDPNTPVPLNNTHVLFGAGDGSFTADIDDYTVAGAGTALPLPSNVNVVSDPFKLLSTFNVGGTTVSVNLLRNGNFEVRDLAGEQGNLDGWTTFKLTDTTKGSAGQFLAQSGSTSPLSGTTVPPPANGKYQAMLDQQNLQAFQSKAPNPNDNASYAGSHALYQDVTIPNSNTSSVKLSLRLYLNSADAWSDAAANPQLDYRTTDPNQQVRVDIMAPTNNILDVGTGVKLNVFQTTTTTTTNGSIVIQNVDLSAFKGQTIRVRIAATNNQGKLIVGVDDVRVQTVFTDGAAPQILSLNLRNPTFLSAANSLEQSTDPTIVGKLNDNGSINNIKQVTFDLANNGIGGADDVSITTLDANGYFTFTPTTLLSGIQTIPVEVTDQAGNTTRQLYQFILQGPSLTNWQSAGPGPIDVSSAGFNFNTVSGKITGIAVDPTDPSGNTFYVGSANGGVWKTTDGGKDWLALTDNVRDATGQRINVSVGALALAVNPLTGGRVIYAATGLDDNAFTSRSSIGVLRSTDDGRTWSVIGGATATTAGIFTGARVSKIAIDPRDVNVVYVAITSWDDKTKSPMILKTTNGLGATPTWTNVLNPANMFTDRNGAQTLGAGYATLASVTDLIVDPFNPGRVIIGLGNIGQRTADDSAGVWKSIDGGSSWDLITGGDNLALSNADLPTGTGVGRVTLAQGNGRVGDERFVYVLMSNPPTGTNQFDQGDTMGLYKTKDNLLNFTKVLLTDGNGVGGGGQVFTEIGLLGREGGNVGSLLVDPSNPNVVYVGGSRRFAQASDPNQHALLRVDTGNMRDTTYFDPLGGNIPNDGDDITKAFEAATSQFPGFYTIPGTTPSQGNAYTGEGVYWYDVEQDSAQGRLLNQTGNRPKTRLPPSIQRLTFDTQGRLLIGTENGLYRGNPLGFGYDFNSDRIGIVGGGGGGGGFGGGGGTFTAPGMTVTELNGNLQITDLTSVAIDPSDRNRLYVSASGVGTALTPGGVLAWQTMGLTGPSVVGVGNLGIPNAFQVLTANAAADAPADAITTLYRTWQFRGNNSLIPEVSLDAGGTFSATNSAGISSQDSAGIAPVLAINPVKANVNGQFFDELLFGTDKVYLTRTGGNVWDAISGQLGAGFVSALAFSPTPGEYLAGNDEGRAFIKPANGANFIDITGTGATSLSTLSGAGPALSIRINGITVDPNNPNVVYVMMGTPAGKSSVYRGTLTRNATTGAVTASWAAVATATNGLPRVASYAMVIDRRVSTGAPSGRFYVGTDRGVFTSIDNGATWAALGAGLPAAPVVNLQFNPTLEVLAAATQGRGVFTLSTARSGPYVVSSTPTSPVDNGPLTEVTVTFNTPVDPRTFTAEQNAPARTVLALIALTSTDVALTRTKELVQQYLGRAATQADLNAALPFFFVLNPDGSIATTTDPAVPGVTLNITRPDAELRYTAFLVASANGNEYFSAPAKGNGTNATWIESIWQDLLHRTSVGDSQAATFLTQLNASPVAATRMNIALQITGVNVADPTRPFETGPNPPANPYNPINPLSKEFHTILVASMFNKYLGRNYDTSAGNVPTLMTIPEINTQVATLQRRGLLRNVDARIVSTTEAYQKLGNDFGLPPGFHATAVTFGNFTGQTVNVGQTSKPVLDMAVAIRSTDPMIGTSKVVIFQGKPGGGFSSSPPLTLNLPNDADPAALVVADFDNDGDTDLAVANSGLSSASNNSVSVFRNNRGAVGVLSFDPTRLDFNGGNNPVGLAVGNIDGDGAGNLDLVAANRTVNGAGNYTVTVLLGNGAGGFGAPTAIKVGDNVPNASELTAPTGIAVANVTGGALPDLIVSGDNGLVVLNNTTAAPGLPTFAALAARLTSTPTTSVAAGNLDSDSDNDIVATSDNGAGELLVFRNDAGAFAAQTVVAANANPRSVQLGDMNGDGKLDAVVANDILVGGGITVIYNTTAPAASPPDTLAFGAPLQYPVTGNRPSVLGLGDTNQDGILDIGLGYEGSEFASLLVGQQQGLLKVATDVNWLDWIFQSQASRPFNLTERSAFVQVLATNALAYINGSDGVAAPLSITPTDSTNLTYSLKFAPRILDGQYRLFISPNVQNINLKDFIDLNGTYTNTGNPMNQDRDALNGEVPQGGFPYDAAPGDRYSVRLAVNNNDTGRFLSALYEDLQGTTATSGREPDNAGFLALVNGVEAARLSALNTTATQLVGSQEEVDLLVNELYQRYLRRPAGGDLVSTRNAIVGGTLSFRQLVVNLLASDEYFNHTPTPAANFGGNGSGATWWASIYADVLPGAVVPPYTGSPVPGLAQRTTLATNLVFSDPAVQQTVTEYFLRFLGRTPVRNAVDARLDEMLNYSAQVFNGVFYNFTALLKTAPSAGQLTGDQQLIVALVSSQEYLRLNGNSNFEWLRSIYTEVLGRAAVPTVGSITAASWAAGQVTITASNTLLPGDSVTIAGIVPTSYNGTFTVVTANATSFTYALATDPGPATVAGATVKGPFDLKLDALLNLYTPARATALTTITGNAEFRARFFTDYYNAFLGRNGAVTGAELAAQEAFYQNTTATGGQKRLEFVIANLVSTNEFDPLSGPGASNVTWLTKAYQLLLGRAPDLNLNDGLPDTTEDSQLRYLNANTTGNNAQLATARFNVAKALLGFTVAGVPTDTNLQTEYRKLLIVGFFNTYLNRNGAVTNAERDAFVNMLVGGATQEAVLVAMLKGPEYYRLQ